MKMQATVRLSTQVEGMFFIISQSILCLGSSNPGQKSDFGFTPYTSHSVTASRSPW